MLDATRGLAERAAEDAHVSIRSLGQSDEMAAASRLWAAVWGSSQSGLQMHPGLLVALAHTGNYVAGAYSGDTLVGAAAGFFHSPSQNSLHSHIAGVLPGHTGHGVAKALKLHQAAWCLEHGVTQVTWTFDPLVARNAHLNLVTLGTSVVEYLEDLYGRMTDGLNAGQATDRLLVRWNLTHPPVRTAWPPPGPGGPLIRSVSDRPAPILGDAGGWRWCTTATPGDVEELRRSAPQLAGDWRRAQRAVFQHLLAAGWVVVGFDADHGYHWQRRSPDEAAGR